MRKQFLRKASASILALLLLANVTACSNETNPDVTDNPPPTGDETTTKEAEWYDHLGDKNFNGKTVHVLSRNDTASWVQAILEMGTGEANGEIINDKIVDRNRMIEEKYGIKFEITNDPKAAEILKTAVMADENIADIAFISLYDAAAMQNREMLYDLKESPYIDFDKPWWDQHAKEELAVGDKLYMMCGDLTMMTGQGTWLMYFTKQLIEDNKLDNPYELVDSNKWTVDKMNSMLKVVSADVNGDTVKDELDRYGLLVQTDDAQMLYQALGGRYTQSGKDGSIELSIGSTSRSIDILDKIAAIYKDTENVLNSNRYASKYTEFHTISVQQPCLQEGRTLFYMSGVLRLFSMRDYNIDFGVLPLPKYDENQEDYCHSVKGNWGSGVVIPITTESFDDSSFILEAIAAATKDTVTPAYYTTTLGAKLMRDERSYDMLDIVMKSRSYDIMTFYTWGRSFITSLNNITADGGEGFASAIESKRSSLIEEMKKTFEPEA